MVQLLTFFQFEQIITIVIILNKLLSVYMYVKTGNEFEKKGLFRQIYILIFIYTRWAISIVTKNRNWLMNAPNKNELRKAQDKFDVDENKCNM